MRPLPLNPLCVLALLSAGVGACGGATPDTSSGEAPADAGLDVTEDAPDAPSDVLNESNDAHAPLSPAQPVLTRLTQRQLRHAFEDLLGAGLALPPSLEPDAPADGMLTAGGAVTSLSPRGVELLDEAARSLAGQVVASPTHRDRLAPCAATLTTGGAPDASAPSGLPAPAPSAPPEAAAACLGTFLDTVGRRAWRRPLTDTERERLLALGLAALASPPEGAVATGPLAPGTFDAALGWTLSALLASPNFLYRAELGEPDGDGRRYTGLEMASRLAFFLWASPPDDALLDAGLRGDLVSDAGLVATLDRMLADPRAERGVLAFFAEWLQLHRLKHLAKDPNIFRHFSPDLGDMAAEETLALVEHLFLKEDADLRELLLTRTTFVNRRLAAIYNVRAPTEDGFGRIELPANGPRRGLLGQVSFLGMNAHPTSSSATLRGVFLRQTLLCETVPPPPSDLNTAIPEPSPELPTLRDRLAAHRSDPSCAGCHALTDIPGLGLEPFDGLGRFRETEGGAAIDASGRLGPMDFDGPASLAEAVAHYPGFLTCAVRRLYTFAVARPPTAGEEGELARLAEAFRSGGHRVRALQRAIALSPGFRRASEVTP